MLILSPFQDFLELDYITSILSPTKLPLNPGTGACPSKRGPGAQPRPSIRLLPGKGAWKTTLCSKRPVLFPARIDWIRKGQLTQSDQS